MVEVGVVVLDGIAGATAGAAAGGAVANGAGAAAAADAGAAVDTGAAVEDAGLVDLCEEAPTSDDVLCDSLSEPCNS